MRPSKRDLYKFMAKKADPETRARIAAELAKPASQVRQWYEQLQRKLADPLNVDWAFLVGEGLGPTETAAQPEELEETEPERDVEYYFDLDLSDLISEFDDLELAGAAYRGPTDNPLAPFLVELKIFVCETWNWPERRNNPEYQDPRVVASRLSQALEFAELELPFPSALIAATLVKTGLDRLCQGTAGNG